MSLWDEKYRSGREISLEPLGLVAEAQATAKPGRALDLACGLGRHSFLLAAAGWDVTAVDSSQVAADILAGGNPPFSFVLADLAARDVVIQPAAWDLICKCQYLQRDLFADIRAGVRPGGVFVASIAMHDEADGLKPMNPAYLLEPGELLGEFKGWDIRRYSEERPNPNARRVARLIAVRPPSNIEA